MTALYELNCNSLYSWFIILFLNCDVARYCYDFILANFNSHILALGNTIYYIASGVKCSTSHVKCLCAKKNHVIKKMAKTPL